MAGVDTSIYGQVAPPPDPFAIPNKLLGLNTQQIENQILQRSLGGQQAVQNALSQAIQPDGSIDMPTLHNALKNTPGVLQAPALTQEGQKITSNTIANTGAGQALQGAQIGSVGTIFGAELQGGGPFGRKEALSSIIGAVQSGQITPAVGNTLMHQLPRTDDAAKAWANGMFLRTLPNAGAQPTQIGVTPGGAPVTGTTGQVVTKATGSEVPTDAAGNALNPDGTPTSSNLNPKTGIVTPPAAKAAPAKPGTMGFQSGLAPGEAGSAEIDKAAAAQQGAKFETAVNASPEIKADIDNAKAKLKNISTGPLADKLYKGASAGSQLLDGVGLPLPGIVKSQIADFEDFRKLAQSIAVRQFASLGGTGTDSQLGLVQGANPGPGLSNMANNQMLAMIEGNQDAMQAKATAWRKYKQQNGASANFNTFSEDFNNSYSPRAFQFVRMPLDERKELVKSMSPTEKSQLNTAVQTALDRGWISKEAAK